ncbi:zinc-binding dehydrogenase [Tsukamurella soli]|uniref:L-idonate 5-dehydrogenase n=1 Tax=Tsukamurella soli TaxID=644556 RepID=A0ABP8JUM9_9ACTN
MKRLAIHAAGDLRSEDVPPPTPEQGEVRIKPAYVGICGSDIHYYFDGANGSFVIHEPLVPGHEISGIVDLDPSGMLAAGTPVTVHPAVFGAPVDALAGRAHMWPGGTYLGSASTTPHKQGAMADLIVARGDQVRTLPAALPILRAVLSEPLAVGLHALARADVRAGSRVLVSGCGPIGLLAAHAAVLAGARVTCGDVVDSALDRARELGAVATIRMDRTTPDDGAFDVVLECSGAAPAIQTALRAVRVGGTVVQVGNPPARPLPIDLAPMTAKEIQYLGSQRFLGEIDDAIEMLAAHPSFDAVISHVEPAADAVRAFEVARNSGMSAKVVVAFDD